MFFLFKEIPVIPHFHGIFSGLKHPPCSPLACSAALCQALGPEKVWQRDGRGWTWQLSELEKESASDSFYCWRQSSVDGNLTWSNLVVNNSIFEPRFFFGGNDSSFC